MDQRRGEKSKLLCTCSKCLVKHMLRNPDPNLGHQTHRDIEKFNRISYEERFNLPPHLLTYFSVANSCPQLLIT